MNAGEIDFEAVPGAVRSEPQIDAGQEKAHGGRERSAPFGPGLGESGRLDGNGCPLSRAVPVVVRFGFHLRAKDFIPTT